MKNILFFFTLIMTLGLQAMNTVDYDDTSDKAQSDQLTDTIKKIPDLCRELKQYQTTLSKCGGLSIAEVNTTDHFAQENSSLLDKIENLVNQLISIKKQLKKGPQDTHITQLLNAIEDVCPWN